MGLVAVMATRLETVLPQTVDKSSPFVEDNNEDKDKVNEEPMEEDGKQNETAPKQPPTSLPPNAGGAAGGPGGAAQAKAV
jgi:hypothetical protein